MVGYYWNPTINEIFGSRVNLQINLLHCGKRLQLVAGKFKQNLIGPLFYKQRAESKPIIVFAFEYRKFVAGARNVWASVIRGSGAGMDET